MTDLPTIAKVSRPVLGGGDLYINASPYRLVGPTVMGSSVQWERKTASSPWVDGDVTVARRRPSVRDTVSVYVTGTDQANMQTNITTLVTAFTQDRYTLQIQIGNANWAWDCEAADYSVQMETVHMYQKYVVCTFEVIRRPIALAGGF